MDAYLKLGEAQIEIKRLWDALVWIYTYDPHTGVDEKFGLDLDKRCILDRTKS